MADEIELLVCTTCRAGEAPSEAERPGQRLFDALTRLDLAPGVTLQSTGCLQNCDRGCTVVLRGGARRWTYVYGALDPVRDPDLLAGGARQYLEAADGVIPWRTRSEHFKRNCIARIPPQETSHEND